jgi:hypothetical protein
VSPATSPDEGDPSAAVGDGEVLGAGPEDVVSSGDVAVAGGDELGGVTLGDVGGGLFAVGVTEGDGEVGGGVVWVAPREYLAIVTPVSMSDRNW